MGAEENAFWNNRDCSPLHPEQFDAAKEFIRSERPVEVEVEPFVQCVTFYTLDGMHFYSDGRVLVPTADGWLVLPAPAASLLEDIRIRRELYRWAACGWT